MISGIATITILVGALYVVSEAFAYWLNIINPTNSSLEANKEGLNRVKDSTVSAKEAVDNLSRAMDTQRDAADKLRGANLSLEGANLAVESAQIRYTEAVARYGGQYCLPTYAKLTHQIRRRPRPLRDRSKP